MTEPSTQAPARRVELALFKADATRQDLEKLCADARARNFHGVCVNGSRVELARTILEDTDAQVTALIGFPLGAADSDAKRYEIEIAVDHGAHELEAVLNIGRLKEGDHRYVLRELRDLVEAADERPVKVVLKTHLLTREETILACELVIDSGAQFVVNATDYHAPAVTVEEVAWLRKLAGENLGVKAVGGISDERTLLALLEAGAARIGTTATLTLTEEPSG